MKAIQNVIKFLKDYVIECDPEDGCGRCNEAREHVAALEKLSLPPAEGAEEILKHFAWHIHPNDTDKVVQYDDALAAMQEFASHQQPPAEGAEDMTDKRVKEILGDRLCNFCPLEKKGVYGVPGGYAAGCEGSKCDEALDEAIQAFAAQQPTAEGAERLTAEGLLPCPFCGSEAEKILIGSDYTKTRKVVIKCSNRLCRTEQITGAIRHSHQWCEEVAIAKWNLRQEVERVIGERMPTDREIGNATLDYCGNPTEDGGVDFDQKQGMAFQAGAEWFRNRMKGSNACKICHGNGYYMKIGDYDGKIKGRVKCPRCNKMKGGNK